MKKKIRKILKKWGEHSAKIGTICALLYSLMLVLGYYLGNRIPNVFEIICAILMITLYAFLLFFEIKEQMLRKAIRRFLSSDLYFHGELLTKYVEKNAFLRLEQWLDQGLCYELAAIAMILLSSNKSARLCQGAFFNKDGEFDTCHAWVEFKIPLNGWWVADFAWINIGFSRKKDYFTILEKDGSKLEEKWDCPQNIFNGIELVNLLKKAMKDPKTSNVLLELTAFGNADGDFGFKRRCYLQRSLRFSDGTSMLPHYRYGAKKPISTEIIQDFVKKRNRLQPKMRTMRITYSSMHKALP